MMKKIVLWLSAAVFTAAADYSRTNLQYLSGSGFEEIAGGYVADGGMTTLTLEHFSSWEYGDNFFFVDSQQGDFDHFGTKKEYVTYMEWAPRLSLAKISGKAVAFGPIRDFTLSAQLNQGENYRAVLAGVGVDLALPFFAVFSLNVYRKTDNFDTETTQTTLNWLLPMGPVVFEGFVDYTDEETLAQPQLLLDFTAFGMAQDRLLAGVELYYYRTDAVAVAVPQLMLKWVW
jgi:nucleoside-specific outer membrane channel protein Tsx